MKSLLDTDTLSEIFRARNTVVAEHAVRYRATHGPLSISAITVVEVTRGWVQRNEAKRMQIFRRWLASAKVLPLEQEPACLAGEIAARLQASGQPIGFADTCIAAIAIHHRRALVTGNTAHFQRVCNVGFKLKLENWRDPLP